MANRISFLSVVATAMSIVAAGNAVAIEGVTLTSTLIQDETRRLPSDNLALFTAANRKVTIALDALGANADASTLAGTKVTVVDEAGKTREFVADSEGKVTIEDVTAGAHAVVASNDETHGSSLFVFQEKAQADALEAGLANIKPARMTLLNITGQDLIPVIDDYLEESDSSPFADDSINANMIPGETFGYRVELGPNGLLRGRVIAVFDGEIVLANTTVVIFAEGIPVARSVTDEQGNFSMTGVMPGVHGLVAAGPAGYAAFAFEALSADAVTKNDSRATTLVSHRAMEATTLPVVLIPPKMVQPVVEVIRGYYPGIGGNSNPAPPVAPVAPGLAGAGALGGMAAMNAGGGQFGGGGGGAVGGAGAGAGGLGGLGGLGALGAVGAAVAVGATDDGDAPGIVVSPSTP